MLITQSGSDQIQVWILILLRAPCQTCRAAPQRWCFYSCGSQRASAGRRRPSNPPCLLSPSAMATYPPTCSNTNTSQGMNMANSIANLRLKAKEYSLNQVPTVN